MTIIQGMQATDVSTAPPHTEPDAQRRVHVLLNRKSGPGWSFNDIEAAFARHWESPACALSYAFSYSTEDGKHKARQAVRDGIDVLMIGGGDGSISSMGACLIGSSTSLGAVPLGSGNGLARHFNIPMDPALAIKRLSDAEPKQIDVGLMNNRPFLITCSMAWDAALTETFERSPIRGMLSYVLAGVYRFFEYTPHPLDLVIDHAERLHLADPLIFTVANLSQFGGGAVIAPDAAPDDGMLELIAVRRQDVASILTNLDKVFSHRIAEIPKLIYRRFSHLLVRRPGAYPIQMDGECVQAPAEINIRVLPKQLNILAPNQ